MRNVLKHQTKCQKKSLIIAKNITFERNNMFLFLDYRILLNQLRNMIKRMVPSYFNKVYFCLKNTYLSKNLYYNTLFTNFVDGT